NIGTIFPRICSRILVLRRIGRSASPARRGGFAPRGGGALSQCIRLRSNSWAIGYRSPTSRRRSLGTCGLARHSITPTLWRFYERLR
ncbi:hypothetical protein A2U01_0076366, partial [Trifolium medium]|nr:hypothetical protein [Trifolium medium]